MTEDNSTESEYEELNKLLEDSDEPTELSRRKFMAAGSTAGMTILGGCKTPQLTDYGEIRIGLRYNIPVVKDFPLVSYYSPELEQQAQNIHERSETEIAGRSVSTSENKIRMSIDYFEDDEILSLMEQRPGLVGDEEAVTRLIGYGHYGIMRMGVKAGGAMRDIQQYLSKDLQKQYANNAAEPFHQALKITNSVANPSFDISPESDERDDQFIGMNLNMYGRAGSRAGRYFNTTEIKEYAKGSLENLREDLEEEAIQQGGFSFYL